jgi:tetratricopeptide (TPR) repeat protein
MTAKTTNETAAYEQAVSSFSSAVQLVQAGDYSKAKEAFNGLLDAMKDEPVLAERSRMFLRVCEERMTPSIEPGTTADDLYYRAVFESNDGNASEAIALLDQALQQTPNSAKLLYARASAWAISANADSAVSDLRQAIALDPTLRFQAVNDFDFERIREEPSFIDIIEPTSAGA